MRFYVLFNFSLFSVVRIYPSVNGVSFSSSPIVSFNNHLGDRNAHARVFNLPLSSINLLAVALKVIFEVPDGKLMLSEIEFYDGKFICTSTTHLN